MRTFILAIFGLALVCCTNNVEQDTGFSIFDSMRTGYQTMEFISSSKSVALDTIEWKSLETALISLGLEKVNEDSASSSQTTLFHQSRTAIIIPLSAHTEFVLIEIFDNATALNDRWKAVQVAIGMYSGIQNADMGKYYLKLEESNGVSLNATFRNDQYIFNITQELSITNTDSDKWAASEIDEYLKTINSLNNQIELLSDYLVHEKEKIYKPLNGRKLTPDERLFGFIQFWTEVKYNFAFFDQVPELDWDAVLLEYFPKVRADQDNTAYYQVLSEVCALLNDGHTDIFLPSELNLKVGRAPIEHRDFEGNIYLTNFDKSLAPPLAIGLKLKSIDGIPVDEYLDQHIIPYISASTDYIKRKKAIEKLLEGENGSTINLKFSNQSDSIIHLSIKRVQQSADWIREEPNTQITHFRIQDNIGILELNTFGTPTVVDEFKSLLDSLTFVTKLVIDLRKNGGGNSEYGYQILDYFSAQPIITSKWKTKEHKAAYKAWGASINASLDKLDDWQIEAKKTFEGGYWYESPPDTLQSRHDLLKDLEVVILIGNNTASAAEDFLIAAESISLGKTIGDYTFGSTGQPMFIRLPGGGSARICTKKDTYPNGKEFVGYGIKPDILVKETIHDFGSETDKVLDHAIKILDE